MRNAIIIISIFLLSKTSFAKVDSLIKPQVRFSPTMIANLLTAENSYLKLTYGQPYKKGRKIFGNLVPFGEIWRLGANEATEITVTSDFQIGTKKLKAGTYSLFATPNENQWTIHFNKKLGQWGAFEYQERDNIFSFDIAAIKNTDVYEGFTIELREIEPKVFNVSFLWDDIVAILPVKIIDSLQNQIKIETPRQKRKRLRKERRGK